ncbi:MAG: Holliday junction branch migration protein RuvA [Gemmatimonadetes bacterium]|nr:Holliday junction branch migration protein RuvA [Gemmatimonadota bacterium]
MIATVTGVLADRSGETVVIATDGGVGYAVTVPVGVLERLPRAGQRCSLFTELVVREDGWTLFGFDRAVDRAIFQRLLLASGFGPKLALALLSNLGGERTVRAIQGRDVAVLSTVPGIGRKKAERLILELSDRFADIPVAAGPRSGSAAEEAQRALLALGFPPAAADEAVRSAVTAGPADDAATLIKRALQLVSTPKTGGTR